MLTFKHCRRGSQPPPSTQTMVPLRSKLWIGGRNQIFKYMYNLSPVTNKSSPLISEASRKQMRQVLEQYTVSLGPLSGAKNPQHTGLLSLAGRDRLICIKIKMIHLNNIRIIFYYLLDWNSLHVVFFYLATFPIDFVRVWMVGEVVEEG